MSDKARQQQQQRLQQDAERQPERIRALLRRLDGPAVARLDLPARRAPMALVGRDDTRWQRAAQAAAPRDRALAAVMRFAGARIAEAVGLDLDDLPTTQRRQRLRIRGKGRKNRSVPVHPELAAALNAWLTERRTRIYTLPTDNDLDAAIARFTADR